MINISTNINMSRQQPVSSNKTVVKMKDVLRILNDPLDDSMRWITYYKIWFDWDKVVRRHGFSTSRKNFLHNLRTNYQWRQTCSCVNEDECPPNCRKGITEDFWMHDKLKNMEYASLMDIPKKKPGRNQPSPSITRYDLNSPPGTPPSNDEKCSVLSPSSSNPPNVPPAASTPILPPNIAAEMARTQQGTLIRSLLSSLQQLSSTVQQNSRQIEKMRQTDRTFRKQAENEIVMLKQEVHNLKQQLARTNTAITFAALKPSFPNLLQNTQNMMQNSGPQQQQFSIPPPPININTPQVKNEFMDFGNTIPPMFPYQAQQQQQQQTTPVGSGNSSNQSCSSQQTHSASNTPSHSHQSVISPSGTSSSYSTQSTGPNTPIDNSAHAIDPDSEMIEPMTSMTYTHEQGQNINPSSADLQLHDSFHDELGGIYHKQQQNLFQMSGISHHTR